MGALEVHAFLHCTMRFGCTAKVLAECKLNLLQHLRVHWAPVLELHRNMLTHRTHVQTWQQEPAVPLCRADEGMSDLPVMTAPQQLD